MIKADITPPIPMGGLLIMPEKGKRDKAQRETKKKAKLTIKEKRRQKKNKSETD
jgi:hypothetical protein